MGFEDLRIRMEGRTYSRRTPRHRCASRLFYIRSCRFAHVPPRHRACNVGNHVIILAYVVVEQIDSLGGLDSHLEHYAVTTQALINHYLILVKMFLESNEFRDPAPSIQIDTGRFEQLLELGTYPVTFAIRFIFRVFVYSRYRNYKGVRHTIVLGFNVYVLFFGCAMTETVLLLVSTLRP